MNNLVLIRHGQSKFNLQRRFTGFYDVELTTKGEDMIHNNYSGTEFMKSVTKGIIGMSKVEGFKK